MIRSMHISYNFYAESPCCREVFVTGLVIDIYKFSPVLKGERGTVLNKYQYYSLIVGYFMLIRTHDRKSERAIIAGT